MREGENAQSEKKRYEEKAAQARRIFVAALSEWVNMHDWHEPFANGPPSAEQSCAISCFPGRCCDPERKRFPKIPDGDSFFDCGWHGIAAS